jgi:hypothetical protein
MEKKGFQRSRKDHRNGEEALSNQRRGRKK